MKGKKQSMKKKVIIISVAVAILLAVLFVPIPTGTYLDGGTREYTALTYKIVKWNRLIPEYTYKSTSVYFGDDRNKSLDELWEIEWETKAKYKVQTVFRAVVLEIIGDSVFVEPLEGEHERLSSDRITFNTKGLEFNAQVGDIIEITYDGIIAESYPAQIRASGWKYMDDNETENNKKSSKPEEITEETTEDTTEDTSEETTEETTEESDDFNGEFLDKENATFSEKGSVMTSTIKEIREDSFYVDLLSLTASPVVQKIKINGSIGDEWCVGDFVKVEYKNVYRDEKNNRMECDLVSIEVADDMLCYKPVIYLYPEKETEVFVNLSLNGELTCTYPAYNEGWNVTATPDGTLTDGEGQAYNYLYWEGEIKTEWNFEQGFCVKGEDTAKFLETALAKLGLTRREANEFIVYWLPLMQENAYNVISFQGDAYTDAAKLDVSPAPDTVIRVFMTYKASDNFVDITAQELTASERTGFTVVEWGGTEVK